MATSVEEIVNQALNRIGWPETVNNIYDGTRQARVALNSYSQTRDDVLRQFDWGFAERSVLPTLLKQAPDGGYVPPTTWNPTSYPPLPWRFEYDYPSDCIKVRTLKLAPIFIPNFDPQPHQYRIANDSSYTPAKRVILSNLEAAVMVYTAQIVNPATWPPDFTEALIAALAKRFSVMLAELRANMQDEQVEERDQIVSTVTAAAQQG